MKRRNSHRRFVTYVDVMILQRRDSDWTGAGAYAVIVLHADPTFDQYYTDCKSSVDDSYDTHRLADFQNIQRANQHSYDCRCVMLFN